MQGDKSGLFAGFFENPVPFSTINPRERLQAAIEAALADDGADRTALALFKPWAKGKAAIICKEDGLVAGLPLIPLVLEAAARARPQAEQKDIGGWTWEALTDDGASVRHGQRVALLEGNVALLLKAERVILNFITHLSGIANLAARYVAALEGLRAGAKTPFKRETRLLDTRKTLPGLRFPEKYAVRVGGGYNHRLTLEDMLMLKDNHIDAAGSIKAAVEALRRAYAPCPPIEVECRNLAEVREALAAGAERVMLDNMPAPEMREALAIIPDGVESEISGGISLENLTRLKELHPEAPDFVSVGRLTHSAPAADFSMVMLE